MSQDQLLTLTGAGNIPALISALESGSYRSSYPMLAYAKACELGYVRAVELLLHHCPYLFNDASHLHFGILVSAHYGQDAVLEYLLATYPDVNNTLLGQALNSAFSRGHLGATLRLIEAGASLGDLNPSCLDLNQLAWGLYRLGPLLYENLPARFRWLRDLVVSIDLRPLRMALPTNLAKYITCAL